MDDTTIKEFLTSNVELFQGFPDDKLREVIQGSRIDTFEGNEAIIEFGEEGHFLAVLLSGSAEAAVTDNSGEKHRIAVLKAGDIFGEISLMTGDVTSADVIGITRCRALFIPRAVFNAVLLTHPPAIQYLAKSVAHKSKTWIGDTTHLDLAEAAMQKNEDPFGFLLKTDLPAKLLTVNCGSSSLKYSFFDTVDPGSTARGLIERIGDRGAVHRFTIAENEGKEAIEAPSHEEAFLAMVGALSRPGAGVIASPDDITAVGHRVVHGGDAFSASVVIDDGVLSKIEAASGLAPLHNPVNLAGITAAQKVFSRAVHVAVFDTAFHQTLPPYAYLLGLPYELYKEKKIRRYGFHGTSHQYVALRAAQFLRRPFNNLEIISCHLGNGASMCAIDHGRSVDTTMGMTPTGGLIMGTRSGDLDPGALVHLMRSEHLSVDEVSALVNQESGLKGLSGISPDMRDIESAAERGNHRALLAFKSFCYNVRKFIGAYVAAMQGLDVVIFTGGIGQGSAGVRSAACQGLECMGIRIDEEKNRQAGATSDVYDISAEGAPIHVLVIPTDEERMIARETLRALDKHDIAKVIHSQERLPIPVEVSAHHVHLSKEHVEALFGPGHQLTPAAELSQPGQFACEEKVTLIGPKGHVDRVRVLGPERKQTQVEIAMTEQFKLGIHPPIRESGNIENTPGVTLEGPAGTVTIEKGVICAMRHIHMSPEDALRLGLRDKHIVRVRVGGDRELTFGDVLIRVSPNYRLSMHIDTDEANAGDIGPDTVGYIESVQGRL
jgi:acetate kinase